MSSLTSIPPKLYHFSNTMSWASIKKDGVVKPFIDAGTQRMGLFALDADNFQAHWPGTRYMALMEHWLERKTFLSPDCPAYKEFHPISIVVLELETPSENGFSIRPQTRVQVAVSAHNLGRDVDGYSWREWQMYGREYYSTPVEFMLHCALPLHQVRKIGQFAPNDPLPLPQLLRNFINCPQIGD